LNPKLLPVPEPNQLLIFFKISKVSVKNLFEIPLMYFWALLLIHIVELV